MPQRLSSVDGHPFPGDRSSLPSHMTNERMHKMTQEYYKVERRSPSQTIDQLHHHLPRAQPNYTD